MTDPSLAAACSPARNPVRRTAAVGHTQPVAIRSHQ
jgi:hypothetical protein